ncbi:TPA: MetQ/NlpA family ABC transporter substrate-binding protein [Staphylococcus aureus]
MKRLIGLVIVALVLLAACGSNNDKKVTIGVASNDTKAWEKVKELAKKDDIDVEIKHFSDYNLPNKALNDGAKVVIPNDVSNQARALKLLEAAGLIKLKKDFGLAGTVKDITSNPKHLKITAVDAQQTARALSDVDIAVINNGVATKAGKDPKNDPIFLEKSNSDAVKPYINIVAVNDKDLDNKTYAKIVELYHSKEAQKALQEDVKDGEKPVNLSKDEIKAIETSLAK